MDFWITSLIIFIILLSCGSLTFIILLFVGGTSSIVTILSFADKVNSEIAFLIEVGLWAVEHHINNFLGTMLTGNTPLFYLQYFKSFCKDIFGFRKFKIRYTYLAYISVVGIVGIYAIFGEIIEQCGRKIIRACIGNNTVAQEQFEGYSSETLDDVILSDLAFQYLLTSVEALILLIFIFESRGTLFFFKKWYVLLFRFVLKILLPVIGFLGTLRKDFGSGYAWPIGFYAVICLKLLIICILFLEDYIHITKSKKVQQFLKVHDVTDLYIFLLLYTTTQYIVTFNLTTWGLIISHIVAISYIIILFFIKIKSFGNVKTKYTPLV